MRRLVSAWFCFFMVFIFLWAYHCDTEYSKENILGEGFTAFSLSCNEATETERTFSDIIAITKRDQIDVAVFEVSYEDGQRKETYFKTNISNDFLNISTAKGSTLLNSDEYFANMDMSVNGLRAYKLNTTAVDSIIIYPFEQLFISGYDICNCVLYCKTESAKKL